MDPIRGTTCSESSLSSTGYAEHDGMTVQAERGYRQGLLMYPKNPALLRSYAQFMQDIKLNPHASMRYWVEADKLEAQQTEVRASVLETACMDF